ncbi:MAG: PepSY domain-containing protein [Rhizobium sp.]|nr:MAG: PepSY domain-containing protein [Rhizobium sp.]
MNKLLISTFAVTVFATASFAQSEKPTTSQTTPAVNTKHNPGAPIAGKNSFTEKQAKSRIEKAGYKNIRDLKLDSQGVWRATADKDGKPMGVSLDFQGNVTMAK